MPDVPATAVEKYLGDLQTRSIEFGAFRGTTLPNSTLQRGFEAGNPITSAVLKRQLFEGVQDDPEYNAFIQDREIIERFPQHARAFTESGSAEETRRIVAQIELENSNRENLAGVTGFLAQIAGASADPINLAFIGPTAGLGLVGRTATGLSRVGRVAGATAAEGFVASLWAEAQLQESQITRTGTESALNIAASTIFSGLFGGTVAGAGELSNSMRGIIRRQMIEAGEGTVGAARAIEEDIRAHYEIPDDQLTGDFLAQRPAHEVNRVYLNLFEKHNPDGVKVIKNLNSPVGKLIRAVGFGWNPMGRGSTAKSGRMRIATRKLAETGFVTDDLDQVAKIGTPVEVNLQVMYMKAAIVQQDGHQLFSLYRKAGDPDGQLPTLKDFNEATGRALRNDDKADWLTGKAKDHVEKNARNMRKFFDGVRDDAIRVGLMTDMDLRGTAASYFTRVYDMQTIGGDPEMFAKWLVEVAGLDRRSAKEVVQHIEGLPTGSANFNGLRNIPSSVRRRMLEVKDDLLSAPAPDYGAPNGWLINDVDHVIPRFAHGILPEIEMAKAFPHAASARVNGLLTKLQSLEKTNDPFELLLLDRRTRLLEISQRLTYEDLAPARALELEDLLEQLEKNDRLIKSAIDGGKSRAPKGSRMEEKRIRGEIRRIIDDLNAGRPSGSTKITFPQKMKIDDLSDKQVLREITALNDRVSSVRRRQAMRAVELDDEIAGINEEYMELRAQQADIARNKSLSDRQRRRASKEVERLRKEQKKRIDDLTFMRDKLLNRHMIQKDGVTNMLQAESALMKLNFMTMLGGVVVSSIPDLAMPIFVNGLRPWARAVMQVGNPIKALIRGSNAENKEELVRMVRALELLSSSRVHQIADIFDAPSTPGKVGEAIDVAAEKFTAATMINRWNGYMKSIAAMASMNRIVDDVNGLRSGKITGRRAFRAKQRLALSGISEDFYDDIAEMIGKHAEVEKVNGVNVTWPRTQLWVEGLEGVERARALDVQERFRNAVVTDVRKTILTPSVGGAPRFMSARFVRVLTQFKRFAVEATNRILISGIQRRDAAVLNGIIGGLFLGGAVYAAKETLAGRELSDDPGAWVFEGIDRSGILGLVQEMNNVTERITRGRFGLAPLLAGDHISTRYTGRNLSDAVLGPSLGRSEDILQIGAAFSQPDTFDAYDTRRIRRMLPMQNLFYARWLFDQGEKGFNRAFDLGERAVRAEQ